MTHRPREIVALMLERNDSAPIDLPRIVARLTGPRVATLFRGNYVYSHGWPGLFARLTREQRPQVYAALGPGLRDEEGLLDPGIGMSHGSPCCAPIAPFPI